MQQQKKKKQFYWLKIIRCDNMIYHYSSKVRANHRVEFDTSLHCKLTENCCTSKSFPKYRLSPLTVHRKLLYEDAISLFIENIQFKIIKICIKCSLSLIYWNRIFLWTGSYHNNFQFKKRLFFSDTFRNVLFNIVLAIEFFFKVHRETN